MAALRIWMLEDTLQVNDFVLINLFFFFFSYVQYDAYIHNLWLSRLRTLVVLSDEDKMLDKKLLDALIKDLAVEPFNKCR